MTIETGIAFLAALIAALIAGPFVIERMRVLKFGQNINQYVEGHAKKQGTPTMGGLIIGIGVIAGLIGSTIAGVLLDSFPSRFGRGGEERAGVGLPAAGGPMVAVALVFVGNLGLGFLDDYLSIKRGKNLGLKAREKLLGQFVIAGLFVVWLYLTQQAGMTTVISFGPGHLVDLHWGYYVIALLLIMGMSNATNLTDGLDGLLGGTTLFASAGICLTVYSIGVHQQLHWFAFSLIGGCLGFLWYNAHPAKIFMGDTGSLAIGASLAAMAIAGKQELLLLVFCIVFLIEMASVMIQVSYFKLTKGKRVFKMTPIHHHFELAGVAETAVVQRFYIVGIIALVIGLMLASAISTFGLPAVI